MLTSLKSYWKLHSRRAVARKAPCRSRRFNGPVAAECLETRVLLAATQVVTPAMSVSSVGANQTFTVDVNYSTTDGVTNTATNQAASGMTLRLYYNSSAVTFNGVSNVAAAPTRVPADPASVTPQADSATNGGGDGDPLTDRFINIQWGDTTKSWPTGFAAQPVKLYTASFTTAANFAASSTMNFRSPDPGTGNDGTSNFQFAFKNVSLVVPAAVPTQVVTTQANLSAAKGGQLAIDVNYATQNPANNSASGMTLRLYYNSSEMTFNNVSNVAAAPTRVPADPAAVGALLAQDDSATNGGGDGDASTDKFINIQWGDTTKLWPTGFATQPVKLYTANFTASQTFTGSHINFRSPDPGTGNNGTNNFQYAFQNSRVNITEASGFNFDIDGNGVRNAFQDAALVFAWLLGPDISTADFQKLIPANASAAFDTAAEIKAHLDANQALFDIDGNGTKNAFQDAVLLYAWMLGPDISDADFQKLIPANAAQDRNTAAEIKAYLNNLQGVTAPATTQPTANNIVITPQPTGATTTQQPANSGTTGVTPTGDQTLPSNDETAFLEPGEEDESDLFNFDSEPSGTATAALPGLDLLFAAADSGSSIPDDLLDLGL